MNELDALKMKKKTKGYLKTSSEFLEHVMDELDELNTTKKTAAYLKTSPEFLEQARLKGNLNLPFVRVGARTIRYRRSDILEFVRSLKSYTSTSSADQEGNK